MNPSDIMGGPKSRPESLTIVSVATNIYLRYWVDLVDSFLETKRLDNETQFVVFTDQLDDIPRRFSGIVQGVRTPRLGWPDATLKRYELISRNADVLTGNIVMHLDSDMRFAPGPPVRMSSSLWRGEMALVRHPGFYRPAWHRRLRLYGSNPDLAFRDARVFAKYGALGTWESRAVSTAQVPRQQRRDYYCGGTWMGSRQAILRWCDQAAQQVSQDSDSGVTAVWHDESHLNRLATVLPHSDLGPEWCYVEDAPQLAGLWPVVIAVDKGNELTRERSDG
jgi:hypothetical protein